MPIYLGVGGIILVFSYIEYLKIGFTSKHHRLEVNPIFLETYFTAPFLYVTTIQEVSLNLHPVY